MSMFVWACDVRGRVTKEPPPGERERDEQLIGQVLAYRHLRAEMALDLVRHPLGHRLGANAPFTEAGEDLGRVLGLDIHHDDVPWSRRGAILDDTSRPTLEPEPVAEHDQLALPDRGRERGDDRARHHRPYLPACGQVQARQALDRLDAYG